jgi:serine/threonine protein kinase
MGLFRREVSSWRTSRKGNLNIDINKVVIREFLRSEQRRGHPDLAIFTRYAKLFRKRTQKRLTLNGWIYSRAIGQPEFEIVQERLRKGIRVEEPINEEYTKTRVEFKDSGPPLANFVHSLNPLKQRTAKRLIFTELPNLIAKMHELGIKHGHLHLKNITVDNGHLRIIDFSIAERVGTRFISTKQGLKREVKIPWKEKPLEAMTLFTKDYIFLIRSIFRIYGRDGVVKFAEKLFFEYPFEKNIHNLTVFKEYIKYLLESQVVEY